MYVRKRLNLKDIVKILHDKYGIDITTQALYNYLKKYDLLKYRGKGRKLNANLQVKKKQSMATSPAKLREKRMREAARMRRKGPRK